MKVMIPYSRIQNVDVYRGPILRMFDLGDIKLFTAGTGLMEAYITGIPTHMIPQLSEKILSIARASRSSGVVGELDSATVAQKVPSTYDYIKLQEEIVLELKKIRKLLEEDKLKK